jgi:hypothetical protein
MVVARLHDHFTATRAYCSLAWVSEIKNFARHKGAAKEELETPEGQLNHGACMIPLARHFLTRIRAAKNSRTNKKSLPITPSLFQHFTWITERESQVKPHHHIRQKAFQWLWNLIWEWRLTLPSFGLANRQTTACFCATFKPDLGLATGLQVQQQLQELLQTYFGAMHHSLTQVSSTIPG